MDHAETKDIRERLRDVILAWPEFPVTPPSLPVEVRADVITSAFAEIGRLRQLLARYRDETPLGHQPHMIAHEADAALGRA